MFIDESHVTVPQVRGMSGGDTARKKNLIDYGFRLPSAYDNRPLYFEEFEERMGQTIFVSATPGKYETEGRKGKVRVEGNLAYVDIATLARDCDNRYPSYALFRKK